MQMYDGTLGRLEVEIEVGFPDIETSHITAAYKLDSFEECTEGEIEYLNKKYAQDIVSQAILILTDEGLDPERKVLH